MLILPYRVDGPADHRPWGTIGLIVVNILVTFLLGFPGQGGTVDSLVLRFDRFHPLTWISNGFVHAGAFHLLFNMMFLWWFGVIVEGLVGWRKFVPLYLAIGVIVSVLLQLLMWGRDGGAVGASDAIFGTMAVAALWAPENKVEAFVVLFYRRAEGTPVVEFTVLGLASIYVGVELLFVIILQFSMSSALIHLFGAAAGLGLGTWMLRAGLVKTGGWDWYSLRKGRPQRVVAEVAPKPLAIETPEEFLVTIRKTLDARDGIAADACYERARQVHPDFTLPQEEERRLVETLASSNAPEVAIRRMERYVHRHPEVAVRITLARLLLTVNRPRAALDQLEEIEPSSEGQRAAIEELRAGAQAALDSTGLELE